MAERRDDGEEITEDKLLGGRLTLRQPVRGHRAGHDAMLLAASTGARQGDRVVDFGAGVGAAGLALAARVANLDLVLVEIDPELCSLARDNAARNNLAARIVTLDIGSDAGAFVSAGLPPDSADHLLMNPPFNDPVRHRASPDAGRGLAHVAAAATLEGWIGAARRVLKSKAVLTMIWRADGLVDVLTTLQRGFGSIAVQAVHGEQRKPAIRVLVRAVKGGRAPLTILPALYLDVADDGLEAAMRGQAALPLAGL